MNNSKGFTLLEVLISFSILLMITTFLSPLLLHMDERATPGLNKLEWEVFKQQVKMEVRESTSITPSGNILFLSIPNGSKVSYEPYQNIIRRRVNGTGHEVMLQHVKTIQYESMTNGVIIKVTDVKGETYRTNIMSIAEIQVN